MSARPLKLVWWTAITLIALVVMLAQIDRYSRYAPEAAVLVPEGFRSFAQSHIASAALLNGTPETALREARELTDSRPLLAEHLAFLAAAQAKNGAFGQSQDSLRLASLRGWRDPGLQLTLLEMSIAAEDGEQAARRFAALLATDGNEQALRATAARVFALPDAQKEMGRLLASYPRWQDRFERIGSELLSDNAYQEITQE